MQDAVNFEQVNAIFFNFSIVLLSKFFSPLLQNSLNFFENLYELKHNQFEVSMSEAADKVSSTLDEDVSFFHTDQTNRGQIKFHHHFDKMKATIRKEIDNRQPLSSQKNVLYEPDHLQLLIDYYMTYVCLWSCFSYADIHETDPHLTNELIESYFNFVKHHLLKSQLFKGCTDYLDINMNTVSKSASYRTLVKQKTQVEKSPGDATNGKNWAKKVFRSGSSKKRRSAFYKKKLVFKNISK